MELTQREKDRIIAEEKVRFEAKKEIIREQTGGRCGHGFGCACGRHGGFLKGLIFGVLLTVLAGLFACHYGHCLSPCGQGKACWWSSRIECPVVKDSKHIDGTHTQEATKDDSGK
jgi:hypothetical protein